MDLEAIVARLSEPSFYGCSTVEVVQTHISFLFLTDEEVFKVKKPVNFGFLDYSTLEKRREMCERELRLNRRLCPDVYLGVETLRVDGGDLHLDGDGEVVEHAVRMRRLPAEGMLRAVLARGNASDADFEGIAATLASFHARAEVDPEAAAEKGLTGVRFNCEENFEQTERYIGDVLDQRRWEFVRTSTRLFLDRRRTLFERRVAEGRIRDGHGDVHLDSICLAPDVRIFDCIEFNTRFRIQDVAEEVAFLAMDLERERYDHFADVFVNAYLAASGDAELVKLLDFYKAYRAWVRAKIHAFQLDDPHIPEARKATVRATAAAYFELAERYAHRFNPRRLVVTCGLTGSGKTYLSRHLAWRHALLHLRSDEVRKELLGIAPDERRHVPYGEGEYSPQMTERTYDEMLHRAEAAIAEGQSVVLDGCYTTREQRSGPRKLAERLGVPLLVLECRTREDVVRDRLARRAAKDRTVSDGRWEIYRAQLEAFEPPDELPSDQRLVVDRSRPVEETLGDINRHLPAEWGRMM